MTSLARQVGLSLQNPREYAFAELLMRPINARSLSRLVNEHLLHLESKLQSTAIEDFNQSRLKELLVSLFHCHILGGNVYRHTTILAKITSALAYSNDMAVARLSLLLISDAQNVHDDLLLMISNTLRTKLASNPQFMALALSYIHIMPSPSLKQSLVPSVITLAHNSLPCIRKRAIICLVELSRSCDGIKLSSLLRRALKDSDPTVLSATLNVLLELSRVDISHTLNLIPAVVHVMDQLLVLPSEFHYNGTPEPWLQMKILDFYAMLLRVETLTPEYWNMISASVVRCFDACVDGVDAAFAILHRVIVLLVRLKWRTSSSVIASDVQIRYSGVVSRFTSSDNFNMRYIGARILVDIVKYDSQLVASYQAQIVIMLEDLTDNSVQRVALSILHLILNEENSTIIARKTLAFLDRVLINDTRQFNTVLSEFINAVGKRITNVDWKFDFFFSILVKYGNSSLDSARKDLVQSMIFHLIVADATLLVHRLEIFDKVHWDGSSIDFRIFLINLLSLSDISDYRTSYKLHFLNIIMEIVKLKNVSEKYCLICLDAYCKVFVDLTASSVDPRVVGRLPGMDIFEQKCPISRFAIKSMQHNLNGAMRPTTDFVFEVPPLEVMQQVDKTRQNIEAAIADISHSTAKMSQWNLNEYIPESANVESIPVETNPAKMPTRSENSSLSEFAAKNQVASRWTAHGYSSRKADEISDSTAADNEAQELAQALFKGI